MLSRNERPTFLRFILAVVILVIGLVISKRAGDVYNAYKYPPLSYRDQGESVGADITVQNTEHGKIRIIGKSINIIEYTDCVSQGGKARLKIKGDARAVYVIKVYLKSGASKSSALKAKLADMNGVVEWEWRVSAGTAPGDFKVAVYRMDGHSALLTYAELPFQIVEKKQTKD